MDADGRIIPMVEDDQGEGVKDPLTLDDILDQDFNEQLQEHRKDLFKQMVDKEYKKGGKDPEYRWSTIPHPPIRPLIKGNR